MPDVMHQCVRVACSFRFPAADQLDLLCPKCGSPTRITDSVLNIQPIKSQQTFGYFCDLQVGLDNLRSVLNVGSIFRSADGAGVHHIHLFGITPAPTHPKMQKTGLGAVDQIPWTQHWDGAAAVMEMRSKGRIIWCLEYNSVSIDVREAELPDPSSPMLLVVGNENNGIDPQILSVADQTVHLPMSGMKESLNVANAFTVAVYWMQFLYRGKHESHIE